MYAHCLGPTGSVNVHYLVFFVIPRVMVVGSRIRSAGQLTFTECANCGIPRSMFSGPCRITMPRAGQQCKVKRTQRRDESEKCIQCDSQIIYPKQPSCNVTAHHFSCLPMCVVTVRIQPPVVYFDYESTESRRRRAS